MSTVYKKSQVTLLIIFIIWGTSCSKNLYPGSSDETIKNGTDNKSYLRSSDSEELKDFFAEGVEKAVSAKGIESTEIIKTAQSYLGVPHCMGGSSKKCTDCSGFVMAVFKEYGISLPHNSEAQARYGEIIRDKEKLIEGDLVFFIESYSTSNYITHAGIYIGKNEFIHTSSSKGVVITSLDNSWWKDKFIFGTRIIEN